MYAVMVCLLMAISPLAMAEEIASNAKSNLNTSIDESDEVEWQVVWQDEMGTVSVENGEPELFWFAVAAVYWGYTAYSTYDDVSNGRYGSAILGIIPGGKLVKGGAKAFGLVTKNLKRSTHGYKHMKVTKWNENVIKSTKYGDAQYKPGVNIASLEQKALEKGNAYNVKGEQYIIYDTGEVIGASNGKETTKILVKISGDTYHSMPISTKDHIYEQCMRL